MRYNGWTAKQEKFMETRARLLSHQLKNEGISNPFVLEAIAQVPRHIFVPGDLQAQAYADHALPIGLGQTISQPFIVARMSELAMGNHRRLEKVLEIGTGSGYQAAVLANLADQVFTLERIESLYKSAKQRFMNIGYLNIQARYSDGYAGLPDHLPYDAIVVTAAAKEIPEALKSQLAEGGRLIIPVSDEGTGQQQLILVKRHGNQFEKERLDAVVFVPMLEGKE
jgi:protein-L-isoaspartate(D-aspartate) O-methyltransferase